MSNEYPRIILYTALDVIEDYVLTGIKQRHEIPDFKPVQQNITRNTVAQVTQDAHHQSTLDKLSPHTKPQKVIPVNSISIPELALHHDTFQNDSLPTVSKDAMLCQACRLFNNRKNAIAHTGNPHAKLIIITDTPSNNDDSAGKLFTGSSGELLEKMLTAIGLSVKDDVIIFPMTKCKAPNREPAPDEALQCSKFLLRQLELVATPLILCFGRVPSQSCTGFTRESLIKLRNTVHRIHIFRERLCVCTYHPRDVLNDASLKRPVWEDLKLLKTLL